MLIAVSVVAAISACSERPTAPKAPPLRPSFATDPGDSGPPAPRNFGPDSYRTAVFTGTGTTASGLSCTKAADKSRVCNGFVPSGVDGTLRGAWPTLALTLSNVSATEIESKDSLFAKTSMHSRARKAVEPAFSIEAPSQSDASSASHG